MENVIDIIEWHSRGLDENVFVEEVATTQRFSWIEVNMWGDQRHIIIKTRCVSHCIAYVPGRKR